MKIKYGNLPFKTNRNGLVKLNAGVSAPNNLNERIKKIPIIQKFKMPEFVYHMSTTPISEFTPNRIFYVSFSKVQAFLHLTQFRSQMRKSGNTKVYVYTLEPIKKTVDIILFNKALRPKNVSNNILGMTYNNPNRTQKAMDSMFNGTITQNKLISENFREGSGDNMILGQILCSKIKNLNGIRNEINQDEFAVCNPRNFFKIHNKETLNISLKPLIINGKIAPGYLPPHTINEPNIVSVEFKRNPNGTSRYVSKNLNFPNINNYLKLLNKYGISEKEKV